MFSTREFVQTTSHIEMESFPILLNHDFIPITPKVQFCPVTSTHLKSTGQFRCLTLLHLSVDLTQLASSSLRHYFISPQPLARSSFVSQSLMAGTLTSFSPHPLLVDNSRISQPVLSLNSLVPLVTPAATSPLNARIL